MGGHSWPAICEKIAGRHCQLWFAVTDRPVAALITQMTVDDVLECLLCGGTGAKEWAGVAEARFAAFAAENGSQRLRIWGRHGWRRVFPHWSVMGEENGMLFLEYGL